MKPLAAAPAYAGFVSRLIAQLRGIPVPMVAERRLVVQGVHAVAPAPGDQHRLADPPPAVLDADAHRGVGADGRGHDGVPEDLGAVELAARQGVDEEY